MTGAAESWAADVARALGLNLTQTTVLRELGYKTNDDWFTYVSAEAISLRTGMSEDTARKAIKAIETNPEMDELLIRTKGARCRGGCLFPDGSPKHCTPGHSMPDGFYLNMVSGEQIIDQAIEQGVKLPSQRHWKNSRVARLYREKYGNQSPAQPVDNSKAEGRTQPVGDAGWPHKRAKPQVRTNRSETPVRYTQPVGDAVQPVGDAGLARDRKPARRASLKDQLNTHSSSTPPAHQETHREGEPPAGAVGEEEPVPGAAPGTKTSGGAPAASGGDPPRGSGPPRPHGVVDTAKVQSMLAAVASESVSAQTAEAFTGLVLGRASEPVIANPTGFVVAAIRSSPGRTRADLDSLQAEHGTTAATVGVGQQRPVLCPLPAHRERGHRQANCPDCRGLTGEFDFPQLVSRAVFDQLADWQQRALIGCGVEVRAEVDVDTMSRSVLYRPGPGEDQTRSQSDAA